MKRIKDEGISIDADHVIREYRYATKERQGGTESSRARIADLLANCLNMRRTARELVLPRLANVESALHSLLERLELIEQAPASSKHPPSQPS